VVVGGVGEAMNATGLPTAARRSTQRFGDLTFGISLVYNKYDILHFITEYFYLYNLFFCVCVENVIVFRAVLILISMLHRTENM
jgi:hypothetical protein